MNRWVNRFRTMTWRKVGSLAVGSILGIFSIFALYLALLSHPGLFFEYTFTRGNITLYSDEPIPSRPAGEVLDDVEKRLARTPLLDPTTARRRTIYICNHGWRFVLFANIRSHVGGLTYVPLTDNIFLRAVRIDANRLVGMSGREVPGERTLSYFIAHEIAHTLVADELGAVRFWRLPTWINEGYADYVAKGAGFSYDQATGQLRRGDREMSPELSGLYLRYHLLVAHLLDKKGVSVKGLLNGEFDPAQLEVEILKSASDQPRRR